MLELRDYQKDAISETYKYLRDGKCKAPIIEVAAGGGKSLIMAKIIEDMLKVGRRVLVVTHVKELIQQDYDEFIKLNPKLKPLTRIYSSGLNSKRADGGVVFAGVQSFWDKAHKYNPFDLIMVDECIQEDELIKVKNGYKKIKDVTTNDYVACYDEHDNQIKYNKPLKVVSSGIKYITLVKHSYGELKCTNTHKIYTEGLWVEAQKIKKGQMIMLEDSQACVMKKLLRASVAVVKELILTLKRKK